MESMKERPVCHRAEDLVSYLYGEASAAEANDFAEHMEGCDSCRTEFASFKNVHESIMLWRNEALGSVSLRASASPITIEVANPDQLVQSERKRSARAALREFFARSPLWLRGATAFATLLLCLLAALAVLRLRPRVPQLDANNQQKVFTTADFHNAVNREVENRMKNLQAQTREVKNTLSQRIAPPQQKVMRPQVAHGPRTRLTPQEREQLAADLRLIPGKEDELPFVFSDEPEQ
jgi:anti-sigma factor RsiW